jgi:hypothetical protein
MKSPSRCRPQLEVLEDRALPSSVTVHRPTPVHTTPKPSHPLPVELWGSVSGTWTATPGYRNIGSIQTLTGQGTAFPLGLAKVSAKLTLPGNVRNGQVQGTLTLSNTQGSVSVQLVDTLRTGIKDSMLTLSYKITGGTGRYAGATGMGVAVLTETTGGYSPRGHGSVPQDFSFSF